MLILSHLMHEFSFPFYGFGQYVNQKHLHYASPVLSLQVAPHAPVKFSIRSPSLVVSYVCFLSPEFLSSSFTTLIKTG